MSIVKLTTAQALVRFMINQKVRADGKVVPLFAGVWAIFGHGNVAGLGEALYSVRDVLPTFRGHNEQSMAHAAIAYA
ncbi:MAG: thiamine pyrophosphate-binding protein, partial [Alphaproteobacteria bacterium]|nr:thiamine pyrophosphate-binding protein [Alphaproteobacteria bacterium]